MTYFQPLEGHVLLRSGGVFSEHQLYVLDGTDEIFARKGNGYIRLMQHNATSKANIFWTELRLDQETSFKMGRLVLVPIRGVRKTRKKAA